jgi:hypothetical protein
MYGRDAGCSAWIYFFNAESHSRPPNGRKAVTVWSRYARRRIVPAQHDIGGYTKIAQRYSVPVYAAVSLDVAVFHLFPP